MTNFIDGKRVIRVGSRTSALALKQTNVIMEMLMNKHCDLKFELVTMDTIGDLILDKELSKIGDKSLFTKELELALQERVVDFVVHSLKDVPTSLSAQFVLAAVCDRGRCEDVVVMKQHSEYRRLCDLPQGSVVGTSSVRRVAQLTSKYPQLVFSSVRGNLNTRLKKLDCKGGDNDQCYEAIILARAGLERLGLKERISEILDDDDCLYAVGQGALACECRSDDLVTMRLLSSIHDEKSALTSIAERSLMRSLDGGCSTPIAVRCVVSDNRSLRLRAAVMSVDGKRRVEDELEMELPEEDLDTVLDQISSVAKGGLCLLHRKRSRVQRLQVSPEEVTLARNADSLFTGVKVFPICDIGRLRMAVCKRLGEQLAERLLEDGAKAILDSIKKTEGELNFLAKPKDKLLS